MEKKNLKQEVFAYMLLILGSALFAVGDVMFVNPYLMAPGGTYGLSNVFSTLWGGKISVWAICMDVPLLIIGTWILGPKFGVKTIISTFLIFGFTYAIESWVWGYNPVIHDGPIVANAIEGLNMVQTHDGMWFVPDYFLNTGGSDIISMILHKYTKISLGTLVTIVDGCITLSTLIAFGDIRLPIYSIIIIFIEGKVIDLVVDGIKSYKTAFIVTDKHDLVKEYILHELNRGGTCITGEGLYNGTERKIIYVTMERADFVKLRSNLRNLDPTAFVNVIDSAEIMGKGFKALPTE